jgi:16S rRNA (cytosine967-C5)-methyltransferase
MNKPHNSAWGVGPGFLKLLMQATTNVLSFEHPADTAMRQFFKSHSSLGRRDRANVSETVFDLLRHKRRYENLSSRINAPLNLRLVLASLARREVLILPETLNPTQHEAVAQMNSALNGKVAGLELPDSVQFSLPDWLWRALIQDFGKPEAREIAAKLLEPAPLDLRVNAFKTTPEAALATLREQGLTVDPIDWMPGALRVQGKPALDKNPCFMAGDVEVQDAGSQWLAALVDAKRGHTVVDFCAGAGGKTLALAGAMRGSGQIFAVDISTARLSRLTPRLVRAGISNIQPMAIDSEHDPKLARLAGRADRVLVDAPCTGVGTLRRNPDIKWRQHEQGAEELGQKQISILTAAAKLVKPKGQLVYATCSLLARENEQVIAEFLEAHPTFELANAQAFELAATKGALEASGQTAQTAGAVLRLAPHRLDSDGFAAAVLRRKPLQTA